MELRLSNTAYHLVLTGSFLICAIIGMHPAAGIDVSTAGEMFVENGTTGTLKCSFKSTEVVSSQASVSWSFIPEGSPESTGVAIFYYTGGRAFPDNSPQFKARVQWAGDMNKKDASIRVNQMQFLDNGTYSCDVKNPPDISGKPSLIKVWVVNREALPQTSPVVIVGAVIGAIIGVIIIAFVAYLLIRLIQPPRDYEGCTSIESVSTQPSRPGKKAESSTEGSRCSSPSAPVQGPVIYAQLDHSGSKNQNSVHKVEPVVYADIRKN
ncbi:myelin protein zero-like 1 like [Astyanax mexicanus]|uniref:Myelin protein zero-like 1 like n=1 Tax=Astyanax mexicanus TaxID=7994 RepID=A0A3B1JIG5_ASTMX|nr:myelin protein zero-like 1 like [Astyanax mexicanus]